MGQDQVSGGVSVLCWLAATVAMFYENLENLVIRSKSKLMVSIVIDLPALIQNIANMRRAAVNKNVHYQTIEFIELEENVLKTVYKKYNCTYIERYLQKVFHIFTAYMYILISM